MAIIPNYPRRLLEEHTNWHQNMNMNIQPGDGLEFLRFHRDFVRRSLRWYRRQGLPSRSVAPWTAIPMEVKAHPGWNLNLQQAEERMMNDLASFESSDELGRYLLTTFLHDAVHVFGAAVYNEPDFGQINVAPRSTLFYNWHRLIDRWWRDFQRIQRARRTRS